MTYIQSIIMGIVEGVTEFLPVSSTGHLILTGKLLHLASSDFLSSFEIVIQLGAILAVVVFFWRELLNIELWKKLIVGFVPTGTIGFLLYKIFKHYLVDNVWLVVTMLFVGGIVLMMLDWPKKENQEEVAVELGSQDSIALEISYKQSFIIGLAQAVAIVPGVSRSAATIMGGLLLGIKRTTIVEFSFLLAVPTMIAASGYDVLKSYQAFSVSDIGLLSVGFIISCIVALGAIKFLLGFVRKHTFVPFGIYRILIALVFALYLFI